MLNFREFDLLRAIRVQPLSFANAMFGQLLQFLAKHTSQHKERGFTYAKRNPMEEQWAKMNGHVTGEESDSGCKDFFLKEMHRDQH